MMRFVAVAILSVIAAPAALRGAHTTAETASTLEARMLHDAADGRFDQFSLLEAALVAGGAESDEQIALFRRRVEPAAADLKSRIRADADSRHKAKTALAVLHQRLLRGEYRAPCSTLQTTLDTGNYNCVSATVLFQFLCEQIRLSATTMASPAHVYTLAGGQTRFAVETTCADWFLVSDEQFKKRQQTGWRTRVTVAGRPNRAREIGAPQLVGKIYYNQGVALLEQRRFEQAIRALEISLQLDARDRSARENLLAAHNNWALEACDDGRFAQAASLLERGREIDPNYEPYNSNDLHIHQKWVQQLSLRHEFAAAIDILRRGRQRRPEAAIFDEGRFAVYRLWLQWLLESDQVSEALDVLQSLQDEGAQPPNAVSDLSNLLRRHAQRLRRQGRDDQAAMLIERGLKLHAPAKL